MTEEPRPKVGFIGLGSQGAPMARRIAEGGFALTLWARRPESLQPFGDTPAEYAPSPVALARECSVVCVCVRGDDDVNDVVLRSDGVLEGLAPGSTLIIHSTVHPDTCIRLREPASERGVAILDAPVSGGAPAAAAGSLLVMVGGDATVLDAVRPVLETFGDPVLHLGELGTGLTAKLVNNFVFMAQVALALETFSFVDDLGLSRSVMAQVLERGSGASRAAAILAGSNFDLSGLRQVAESLLRKDIDLVTDVARARHAAPPDSVARLVGSTFAYLNAPEDARRRTDNHDEGRRT
jgi:3-hydroxyisobutyrate dehydrogenase